MSTPSSRFSGFAAALALTSLSTFVAMVAYTGPLGNAPTLAAALAATPAGVTWILSSMSVGLAVGLLPLGALADQRGRRRVFIGGCLVFAAGSLLCTVAPGPGWFVSGRIIGGLGAAGMIATGLGLVAARASDAADRARSAAWWGASMGLGIASGPLLTGALDVWGLWRGAYAVLTGCGLVLAVLARTCFSESEAIAGRTVDVVGSVLFAAALSALLVAMVEVRQGSRAVAVLAGVAALALLPAFVLAQRRVAHPMIEPGLFRHRGFQASVVAAAGTGAGVIALMSFSGTFVTYAIGLSSLEAGALLAVWSLTSAVSSVLIRPYAARISGSAQLAIGLCGNAVGMAMMCRVAMPPSALVLVPGMFVAGVFSGILNNGLGRQSVATVRPDQVAVGTGVNNTSRYVWASIGVTIVSVVASAPRTDIEAQVSGWNLVAALTAVVSLLAAVVVVALTKGHREQR